MEVIIIEHIQYISLSSNDDKRIQRYDKITTYPYGTNIFKICENETLLKNKFDNKLNNEAQVPRNNSKATRNELINKSQALRNNSK